MKIAVLIPCYNEAVTIEKVIQDFKRELPEADIYVYDNNSQDDTYNIAVRNGAIVKREPRQGKGNVVRSMFKDIDADYYIMVDGDDTYPAESARDLLNPLIFEGYDMVVGDRLSNGTYFAENKRRFHDIGNNLVRKLINKIFKSQLKDIMTGYRAFNRYFVKTMPVMSPGFEIETEITIHALDKKFRIKEVEIDYRDRPEGSQSKLNTFKDGFKVLKTIFWLFKDYKPFLFFNIFSLIFFILGLIIGIPTIVEFIKTGYVSKVPSAILASGLIILSFLSFMCGLLLDTLSYFNRQNYENLLNQYLLSQKKKSLKKIKMI